MKNKIYKSIIKGLTEAIEYERTKKLNTHVYCTDCIYGEELITSIENNSALPSQCEGCYPMNPEDSVALKMRPNYKKCTVG